MKKRLRFVIIGYQAAGFLMIVILLWVDEIFDFPHYILGAPATPVNWQESILESGSVIFLAALVMLQTYKIIKKLKYLEGFLPVCSFCKKIRVDKQWIQIEKYITEHSEAVFSHSLCPECAEENYGDILPKSSEDK